MRFSHEYCRLSAAARNAMRNERLRIAWYTTSRSFRQRYSVDNGRISPLDNDFIMAILQASPSSRDTRSYLASFNRRLESPIGFTSSPTPSPSHSAVANGSIKTYPLSATSIATTPESVAKRIALVKIQGPFSDIGLDSIARGLLYLNQLGLLSVIVVDSDQATRETEDRAPLIEEAMRTVSTLEKQGARARPIMEPIVRLGRKRDDTKCHFETSASDLIPIRSALHAGEIPVVAPLALDSGCRSVRINANEMIGALVRGMVEASPAPQITAEINLTPLRLIIITREGGIPSYARSGLPHLLINLTSEYFHICETFQESWYETHPTALSNLDLARTCLECMPSTSSAIIVSHRSSSSLIGNLVTNKPVLSSSLPYALLQGNRKLTQHTPTLLRQGLPIRIIRKCDDLDRKKLTNLLERSFDRVLDVGSFYRRLDRKLDFVIVAGDYAGAAIVTKELSIHSSESISYLDKFAVLPRHRGDGTVDFLWVALHDETYGLGLPFSANHNVGGHGGQGKSRDLVWRSRSNNPVNKWYFDRSSGHIRMGSWILFWCDGQERLHMDWEKSRLQSWVAVIREISSGWKS